jgi:hypothetical protein
MAGQALLKRVIQTRARDAAPVGALADYLSENLPAAGEQFRVDCRFRTRGGAVVLTAIAARNRPGHYLKIEAFHDRGSRGVSSRTFLLDARDPQVHAKLVQVMEAFQG